MIDLNFKYKDIINFIQKVSPFTPEISIILGSGLGNFAESINNIKSISTADIPGYPETTVKGHSGLIHFAQIEKKKVIIFQGRLHFYEGYKLSDCILPVLLTKKIGCNKILLTNAVGGINRNFVPGDLMLISSFNSVYLKKEVSELLGLASIEAKNNFLNCPSFEMNEIISDSAKEIGISLKSGTYWYTKGPSYETPAEIEMFRRFGADAVGMSTVHEAIFASFINLEVAAISCITNMAAGISGQKLSHEEVTVTARKSAKKFSLLIKTIVSKL
jgi:purine-nucleoside phosphorylase